MENYLKASFRGSTLFDDIYLPHNSLPNLSLDQIDTSTTYLGKRVDFPLMINAMTGGTDFTEDINRGLATIAQRFQLPMAVGSQTIVLEEEESWRSFQVVREIMGDKGLVLGNLNGNLSLEDAKKATDLIKADGLQIHLNPAQELAMEEGDRDFLGVDENIKSVLENLGLPIVVKEVGFGISKDVALRLYNIGVRNIDVSGYGGTNFFEVENLRRPTIDMEDMYDWGIPTAYAIHQIRSLGLEDLSITGSGGIRSAQDLVKSLVLGADMCAISGEILNYLIHGGLTYAMEYVESLIYKTRVIMVLLGAKNLEDLRKIQWKATGKLKDLIEE